jgi:competence protein ComEC
MTIERKKQILFGLILLSLFCVRYYFAMPPQHTEFDVHVEEEFLFMGEIVREPDERDDTTRYVVEPENFEGYKILVTTNRFPKYDYGDVVEVKSKIDFPKEFETDLGRTFDYPNYLAKDGIRYVTFRPQITLVEKGKGSKFFSALFLTKKKFVENIEAVLTEPHSSLANGITLGLKQSLGQDMLDTFRTVGIIHIVVLSGYNMTIILAGVMYALGRFPKISRGLALGLGAILMLLFATIVGFTATVLRATIMAMLAILARFLGRPVLAMRTLFIAGLAMLFWNPLILFHDPSFQLSFLATFGLISVSPIVEKKLSSFFPSFARVSNTSSKWKQVMKEIVTATIATQIFVLPALIYMTGQFSVISLPVNLLVLPLVPTAMLFVAISGTIGFVSTIVAKLLVLPSYIILEFIIGVSNLSSKIPLASFTAASVPLWIVLSSYVFYGWFLWRENLKQNFEA